MLWSWLLLMGTCLSSVLTTLTSPHHTSAPRLLNCTFMERANITCCWEPGDPRPSSVINYTLYIQKMRPPWCNRSSSGEVVRNCSSMVPLQVPIICTTSGTECTVEFKSGVSFTFCINVTAHTANGLVPSTQRCQSGRKEVMLVPVVLRSMQQVGGSPQCLQLTWEIPTPYALSEEEIRDGKLISQIEYSAQGQPNAQVSNVTVNDSSFVACGFKPATTYTIRLRHRYLSEATPWSQWSTPYHGRTGEAAPAVAPQLWNQMNETDRNGWRHVVLLWKPLDPSLANGFVHSYNVGCQTSSSSCLLSDHGSCSVLHHNSTSCSLLLPPERCKCFLTASNSAGTSPEAHIWLPGSTKTEFPPISQITVSSLDDNRLSVRWTAPDDQAVTGFVVEWSAVTEQKKSTGSLQWERLNGSCSQLIITEGVEPLVRYAVTVKALHGEQGAGLGRIHHVYTREGVPSAGPKVTVQEISSNRVELSWNSIPVEQQHGFIRNYTLSCTYSDGHVIKRVFIAGDVHRYSLRNLLPGDYTICMQGNTDAGSGVKGPPSDFKGSENADVLMIMILPVVMTSVAFVLIVCLARNDMVKQTLCQDIPNPSHSSMAHWTPKALLENFSVLLKAETPHIQQVVLDDEAADEATQQNSGPVEVFSYHTVQSPNMHSSHVVPLNELLPIAPIKEDNHSETVLSPCDSTYTQVFTSRLPQTISQALLSYSDHGFMDCQYTTVGFLDSELQLGGDSEPHGDEQGEHEHVRGSALLLSQADKLENPPLTLAEKNGLIPLPASTSHVKPPLSHLTNVCHSSSPLSLSGEESSPQCYDSRQCCYDSPRSASHFNPFPISCSIAVHRSETEPGRLCPVNYNADYYVLLN